MNLRQFIAAYSVALPCTCAQGEKEGNISVVFFHVELKNAPADAAEQLKKLMAEHKAVFCDELNPLDGQPHSFEELGAWLGDQEPALRLIAMGDLLGLWKAYVGNVVALVPTELMRELEEAAARIVNGTTEPASDGGATEPAANDEVAANTAGGGDAAVEGGATVVATVEGDATVVASDAAPAAITNAADVAKDAGAEGT